MAQRAFTKSADRDTPHPNSKAAREKLVGKKPPKDLPGDEATQNKTGTARSAQQNSKALVAVSREKMLPHEILLSIARGEPMEVKEAKDVYDKDGVLIGQEIIERVMIPPPSMQADCAKAAAPYFAPRLATQVITLRGREDLLNTLTDEQLQKEIEKLELAAAAKDGAK